MTDINNLRERVEAAEQRFGLMDEQQRHYSERVIGLIETIEAQLAAARGEIEKQIDENRQLGQDLAAARSEIERQVDANLRLSQDNEELRAMLHSVLRSIEQKTHMKTLQDLEARVSALVASAAPQGGVPANDAPEACEAEAAGEIPSEPEVVVEAADFADQSDGPTLVVEATEDAAADAEPLLKMSQPDDAAEEAVAESDPETPASEQPEALEAAEMPAEAAAELPEAMVADIAAETPDTEAGEGEDEGEDLFAAMAALNASDEAFAGVIAEGPPASEAEAETAETGTAEAEAGDIEAGAADSEAIDEVPEDMPVATAEEPADEADDGSAPTVKEIIRRVGDLARELERAEAARRASRAAGEEQAEPDHPPFERAVNG